MRLLILISLIWLHSCAAITPVASVIGAASATTSAYYQITSDENITVIAPECLWYRTIKLSDESKAGMTRPDKEQLAYLNLMEKEHCHK